MAWKKERGGKRRNEKERGGKRRKKEERISVHVGCAALKKLNGTSHIDVALAFSAMPVTVYTTCTYK